MHEHGPDEGARQEPFPSLVRPMLAMPGELPADAGGWAVEFKWDGVRAISYLRAEKLRVLSRNDRLITANYPELSALADAIARHSGGGVTHRQVVLDGEIVALDAAGRPDFGRLQTRMHVARPTPRLLAEAPVHYYVFDLLHLDGWSTRDLPYLRRRELLAGLGLDQDPAHPVRIPPAFFDQDPADVLAASERHGLEGVVLKRVDARYRPATRSSAWTKVKLARDQEVLIGGWTSGKGRRAGTIGSLLVGVPEPGGGLRYAGHVGAGLGAASLDELSRLLAPLRRPDSPFTSPPPPEHARVAVWARPELVGEVRFGSWTRDGLMRHPVWRGLRPDKNPGDLLA